LIIVSSWCNNNIPSVALSIALPVRICDYYVVTNCNSVQLSTQSISLRFHQPSIRHLHALLTIYLSALEIIFYFIQLCLLLAKYCYLLCVGVTWIYCLESDYVVKCQDETYGHAWTW